MNKAVFLLGTNLGDRLMNLSRACEAIREEIGTIKKISGIYETEPWGIKEQPEYYNQALIVHTALPAAQVLQTALAIEKKLGRVRFIKYDSRTIDIDLLYFNDEIIADADLQVPHPQLQNRRFVLIPLTAIDPEYRHPVLQKTNRALLDLCTDEAIVKKLASL